MLEPLASAMENSGELVSGEDLKSNIDNLNEGNKSWVPVTDSTENVMDMEGATDPEHIPKLCDCLKDACEVEPDDHSEGGEVCSAPTYEGVAVCSVPRDKVEGAGEAGGEGGANPNKIKKTQNHPFSGGTAKYGGDEVMSARSKEERVFKRGEEDSGHLIIYLKANGI